MPVIPFEFTFCFESATALLNCRGLATPTPLVPLTITAFKFFEPITAPRPDLPAALSLSFIIAANNTSFSPAGPMQATFASSSFSLRSVSVVSKTFLPQRCEASFNSTTSSFICK